LTPPSLPSAAYICRLYLLHREKKDSERRKTHREVREMIKAGAEGA
jgi:hypothetical protein